MSAKPPGPEVTMFDPLAKDTNGSESISDSSVSTTQQLYQKNTDTGYLKFLINEVILERCVNHIVSIVSGSEIP